MFLTGVKPNMQPPSDAEELSLELERAALRALADTYGALNYSLFRRSLRRPVLELIDGQAFLGRWVRVRRTIEIARRLLVLQGWGVVVEVLKHEMAHQYVDEVLGLLDETAHGPAFRKVCRERAIDARASGIPSSGAEARSETRVLERVAKLLALAESANVHEAEAAMSAAQRLMLKYNIEATLTDRERSFGFRHLGEPSGRIGASQRVLASILSDHFFVEAIWVPVWRPRQGRRGTVLEICGTVENLELGAYVHSFLTHTAERLWREHKKRHGIRGNAARRHFVAGVMTGFRDKLESERRGKEQQGLVWVGDAQLVAFFRRRHPKVEFRRRSLGLRTEEWSHGRAAGRRIVLHRGVGAGPSGASRLLPARSSS